MFDHRKNALNLKKIYENSTAKKAAVVGDLPAHCFADKLGEFLNASFVRKTGSPADRARAVQRGGICQFLRILARKANPYAFHCWPLSPKPPDFLWRTS